jgi:hypothetical protein
MSDKWIDKKDIDSFKDQVTKFNDVFKLLVDIELKKAKNIEATLKELKQRKDKWDQDRQSGKK